MIVAKNTPANADRCKDRMVWSLGQELPLEESRATHSSVLAWRIPWTEELGRLQSMGCKDLDTIEPWTFMYFSIKTNLQK